MKNHFYVPILLLCKYDKMTSTVGILFHCVFNSHLQLLVGRLLSKWIFFSPPMFCVLLYSELSPSYQISQGETLNYTNKLFDLQQTKEENKLAAI